MKKIFLVLTAALLLSLLAAGSASAHGYYVSPYPGAYCGGYVYAPPPVYYCPPPPVYYVPYTYRVPTTVYVPIETRRRLSFPWSR